MKRFTITDALGTKEIKATDLLDAAMQALDKAGISVRLHPAEIAQEKAKKTLTLTKQ